MLHARQPLDRDPRANGTSERPNSCAGSTGRSGPSIAIVSVVAEPDSTRATRLRHALVVVLTVNAGATDAIGFLALFGVSVQTAVVYISYVNELRLSGFGIEEATRSGALLRLRPIMMTALVAALGLLPAALSTGVGSDTQKPFALVIVGGLFSRLLISIYLMPVLYAVTAREGDHLEV